MDFQQDSSGCILIIKRQEETYTVRIHFVYLGWSAGYVSHTSRAHGGQRARGGEGIVPAHPVYKGNTYRSGLSVILGLEATESLL